MQSDLSEYPAWKQSELSQAQIIQVQKLNLSEYLVQKRAGSPFSGAEPPGQFPHEPPHVPVIIIYLLFSFPFLSFFFSLFI
jgi:hypothetical protein